MRPTSFLRAALTAVHLLVTLQPVLADDAPTARYREVMRALDMNPEVKEHHRACPGEIFLTKQPFWYGLVDPLVEMDSCRANPGQCLANCLEGRNENACFSLARSIQDLPEDRGDYAQMLFAQACAVGGAGGCTNRAAGIRNGGYPRDPFHAVEPGERDLCLLQTFHVTCSEEDAWGCTMLGQAYEMGEGAAPNKKYARQFYRMACMIAPDFAACEMATERLEGLE